MSKTYYVMYSGAVVGEGKTLEKAKKKVSKFFPDVEAELKSGNLTIETEE